MLRNIDEGGFATLDLLEIDLLPAHYGYSSVVRRHLISGSTIGYVWCPVRCFRPVQVSYRQ